MLSYNQKINNFNPIFCQQLEAPELNFQFDNSPPAETIQDKTHQVPKGEFSIFSELKNSNISAAESMLYLIVNYHSTWNNGQSHRLSTFDLASKMQVSKGYAHHLRKSLISKGWIEYRKKGKNTGSTYQITHHNCQADEIPADSHGNPLKIAVPYGENSPFQMLFDGKISWKACLIWILLKENSCLITGKTYKVTYRSIAKWCKFGENTISKCMKELKKAGLVKRLTKNHEKGVYQLYPKPREDKDKKPFQPQSHYSQDYTLKHMKRSKNGAEVLSLNQLWKVNLTTGEISTRDTKRSLWRTATEAEKTGMHPAIKRDFDKFLRDYAPAFNELRRALHTTETKHATRHKHQRRVQPTTNNRDIKEVIGEIKDTELAESFKRLCQLE